MTRFIFLTDTHIGAAEDGYHQQPCYAERLPDLVISLNKWIQENGVDFVLHGGDVVDQVSIESIKTARSLFDLSVPTYVCLGNHDMTHTDAAELWLRYAPDFFPGGFLNFTIPCDELAIHVIPTHWRDRPYYWDWQALQPHFIEEQLISWREMLACSDKDPTIICTHGELAGVPVGQTGFNAIDHAPPESYVDNFIAQVASEPSIRCVLSGHNHINTRVRLRNTGIQAITASAFSETPFEFKVIDVYDGHMTMKTENLMRYCGFGVDYDYDKTFVQGRRIDRTLDFVW